MVGEDVAKREIDTEKARKARRSSQGQGEVLGSCLRKEAGEDPCCYCSGVEGCNNLAAD